MATRTPSRPRPRRPLAALTVALTAAVMLALVATLPGGPAPIREAFGAAPDGRLVVLWREEAPAALADPDVAEASRSRANPRRSLVVARPGRVEAVARRLATDPRVKAVVPDAVGSVVAWPSTAPSDSLWSGYQADMRVIGMPSAWRVTTGNRDVVVAVLDTGHELLHPDLAATPTVHPYNARTGSQNVTDGYGHGTHVAGTIAAVTDNGIGVAGMAPGVTIMPVKVLDSNGYGYWSDFLEGVDWARTRGASIINLSLGSGLSASQVEAFQPTFTAAWEAGVLIVAAAGNNSNSNLFYPASFDKVISVSATNNSDTKANFSNYGPMVDVAAPGVGITSTYRDGTYKSMGGTSMATPHVAGLAALIRSIHPRYTLEEVEAAITETALDLGAPGRDDVFGHGRIVAPAALAWAPPDRTPPKASMAMPLAGAGGVVETIRPKVAFDEPVTGVSASSITLADGAGRLVSASVSWDPATLKATIVPSAPLASRTTYRVAVSSAITDMAGNPLAETAFGFATGDTIAPTITAVHPASGRTDVARGVTIRLTFSEAVENVSGVTLRLKNRRTGERVAVVVRYDAATRTATIDPVYRLMRGTWYRIKVRDGIEDVAGLDLGRRWSSFRTRP